jgi:hypothetical protein
MRLLISMGLLLVSNLIFTQTYTVCGSKDIRPKDPAPCSITGVSFPRDPWLVQVAVHTEPITPQPGVMSIKWVDKNLRYYHVYYLSQIYTLEEATQRALQARKEGFCDAYAVPFPFPLTIFQ